MTTPPEPIRVEEAYPFPWEFREEWTGTSIVAANNKRVVLITKGRAGARITEERVLAELICRCVNAHAHVALKEWWQEVAERELEV